MAGATVVTSEMSALKKRALLTRLLLERAGPMRSAPLSFAQERLWFLEQLQPGNTAYNLPVVMRLREPLDDAVLSRALDEIVARHESLRTTFAMAGGVPVQRIAPVLHVPLEVDARPASDPLAAAQRALEEESAQAFDLQRGPLLRAKLVRAFPGEAALVVAMHHIVSDGWSTEVFTRELLALYGAFAAGLPSPLEPLPIQYADFAEWQRDWLRGERLARQLEHWEEQLRGAPPLLDLPCDRPRPQTESHRGATQSFVVPPAVTEPLRALARERGATPFMVLLALFQALLARTSGMRDIVVGSPIANRSRAELEPMIGFFVNMLALRARVDDELTVRELVDQVRDVTLAAYEHQDLPFEKLVEELRPHRSLGHSPVFQCAFVLQNTPDAGPGADAGALPELPESGEPVYAEGRAKFDLTLSLVERGGGLFGSCEYRTDLFAHRTIARAIRRYVQLLEAGAADPSVPLWRLPFALADERAPVRSPSPAAREAALAGAIGLDRTSRLVVLDGDEDALSLARGAAAAADAAVSFARAGESTAAGATHVLLAPRTLAALRRDEVARDAVLIVFGLPCFDAALTRWKNRRIVGLWGAPPFVPCCATLVFGEHEASIGPPLDGCAVEVLDARAQRQALDVWGEVAAGDARTPPAQLHRTGLVGRRRDDGRIEVLGAASRIVPLDGMRCDPERLATLLHQHPAIADAAVRVQGEGEERAPLAWVVPRAGRKLNESELARFVGERLPAGLIPRRIVVCERLPAPGDAVAAEPARTAVRPRTPAEAVLARIWSEVLKTPQFDVEANFFDQGGNSISSVQVIARVRETLHVDLPLHRLFEAPTIAELARLVESERGVALDPAEPDASGEPGGDEGADDPVRAGRIRRAPPGPRRLRAPLSYSQERLWFLDQFDPSTSVYTMAVTIPLEGAVEPRVVRAVLSEIVRRHEILRTTFPALGGSPQQVIAPAAAVPLALTDLGHLQPDAREAEAARLAAEETKRPFDLARGPLLRARLIRAGETRSYLALAVHHIAFDGWSLGIFMREFRALYDAFAAGSASPLPEPPVQYADFARWQRRWMSGELLASHLEYWHNVLAGAPPLLQLPLDRPRPAVETHRGAAQWFSLAEPTVEALLALARNEQTTLFCVLLTAFSALLMRLCGQDDIVVGTPVANRTRVEIEDLIGFFANTLVLRTDLSGNPTFREAVARAHRTHVGAVEHQDVPFERIVEELQPQRSLNHNPLFQVMLILQNMPGVRESLRDFGDLSPIVPPSGEAIGNAGHDTAKFDQTLTLIETDAGMIGGIEYNTDLFEGATIARTVRAFQTLLGAAAREPDLRIGQLPLLSRDEERALIEATRGPAAWISPEVSVRELFALQASRSPRAAAIDDGVRATEYAELEAASNRLARRIARLGVRPGDRVAIVMPRGAEAVIAILAALKAGAAYVPVDPAYPGPRRALMLADARPALAICSSASAAEIDRAVPVLVLERGAPIATGESSAALQVSLQPDSPAYVLYTSGSTGIPKGVVMPHRAAANVISWQASVSPSLAGARALQFSSLSFDVSFQELFATWTTGGTLVLVDDAVRADPNALWCALCERRVERLFMPYVALQQLAEAARASTDATPPLREVLTSGEQLRITPAIVELFERLGGCILRNQYGPTETHVATDAVLAGSPRAWPALPPIGKPIANVALRLLDRFGRPVPLGVTGEIWAAGACVANGYLDRPELTAERFVPDPWAAQPGARMYRTGDLARLHPGGALEYLGRADQQLKIRGFRIEPGEVEVALTQLPEVDEAVVLAHGEAADTKRLVAYVVAPAAEPGRIRAELAARLPEHLVPSLVIAVDRLPLTPSGKIDRAALARAPLALADGGYEPPATPLERMLADDWAELLRLERVGACDDFFALGGHSLLATRAIAKLDAALGLQLPVRSVFEAPTVRRLAQAVVARIAERVVTTKSEALVAKLEHHGSDRVSAA